MLTAGKILREERIARNRTLSEIADETRIGRRYLEAIEEDNIDILPGEFFYRSFIKQYAQALNLDRIETEKIIAAALPFEEVDPIPVLTVAFEKTRREGRSSGLYRRPVGVAIALLGVVLIGCSALYAFWHKAQVQSELSPEPTAVTVEKTPAATKPAQTDVPARDASPEPLR